MSPSLDQQTPELKGLVEAPLREQISLRRLRVDALRSAASEIAHACEVRNVIRHRIEAIHEPGDSVDLRERIRGTVEKGAQPALRGRAVRGVAQGDDLPEGLVLHGRFLHRDVAEDVVLRGSRRFWLSDFLAL